jgi:hypothetical protein
MRSANIPARVKATGRRRWFSATVHSKRRWVSLLALLPVASSRQSHTGTVSRASISS